MDHHPAADPEPPPSDGHPQIVRTNNSRRGIDIRGFFCWSLINVLALQLPYCRGVKPPASSTHPQSYFL